MEWVGVVLLSLRFATKYDLYLFGRKSIKEAGYNIQDDFLTYQDLSYSLFLPLLLYIISALHMSVLLCCLWFCGMMWQIMCFRL